MRSFAFLNEMRSSIPITKTIFASIAAISGFLLSASTAVDQHQINWTPIAGDKLHLIFSYSLWLFATVPVVFIIEYLHNRSGGEYHFGGGYLIRVVKPENYNEIVLQGTSLIGDRHPTIGFLTKLSEVNRQIVMRIFRDGPPEYNIGYFILYPLTKRGISRILNADARRASQLSPTDISGSFYGSRGIYIAMVAGNTGHAKGIIMRELFEFLLGQVEHGRLHVIFSRPASYAGERVMARYEFQSLPSPSEISVRYISDQFITKHKLRERLKFDQRIR